jgi:hypothetical protein
MFVLVGASFPSTPNSPYLQWVVGIEKAEPRRELWDRKQLPTTAEKVNDGEFVVIGGRPAMTPDIF